MASPVKPIVGSWFSIYWNDMRHVHWNAACMHFTREQWDAQVRDLKRLGVTSLVMCNVMIGGVSVYESKIAPRIELECDDPLEAVLTAADRYGVHVYMNNDYDERFPFKDVMLPEAELARYTVLEELVARYGHHPSFDGWYWAWEACIEPYYTQRFISYVNGNSNVARALRPGCRILTAPYGTKNAVCDAKYLRQLEKLDVDIIAYQDTVGCYATDVDGSARAFEILRRAHDKVPQRALYADVETFDWAGTPNRRETPLISAPIERLQSQLAAVSPFVDEVYAFIFQGLFQNKKSPAYAGYEPGARLYEQYEAWLKQNHPDLICDADA